MGRFVGGVRGITLAKDDEVVGLIVGSPGTTVLTVCEHGYGKRTALDEYRLTKRGGKGVINIKTTKRNGNVIAVMDAIDSDELIMISAHGVVIRSNVSDMRTISRATQGVRLIDLRDEDHLVSVARIEEDKEVEGASGGAESDEAETDGGGTDEGGEE